MFPEELGEQLKLAATDY